MAKITGRNDSDQGLSSDVRNLILRKLRHLQKNKERLLAKETNPYITLKNEILSNLNNHKKALNDNAAPLEAYREICAHAMTVTKEWPEIVWKTIKPILDSTSPLPADSLEINSIIDQFVWHISQEPFTFDYIDPSRFKEILYQQASPYGQISKAAMDTVDRQLNHAAAIAQADISNEARYSREGISIAIDEYLLAQEQCKQHPPSKAIPLTSADTRSTKNTARLEVRRLNTQSMYNSWQKEYRKLMKARPNKSKSWCSVQIAKMDISNGRDSETIRRNLKTLK